MAVNPEKGFTTIPNKNKAEKTTAAEILPDNDFRQAYNDGAGMRRERIHLHERKKFSIMNGKENGKEK